jgi:MFS family permease
MLIQELVHPRLRHLCGSFFQCMYHVGAISASWLVFGMTYVHGTSWAWRAPSLIQGLGPLILVLTIWIPESPRWLIKQGRTEDAHKILAEYQ